MIQDLGKEEKMSNLFYYTVNFPFKANIKVVYYLIQ